MIHLIHHLTDEKIYKIKQICERYGEESDDVRFYEVYLVEFFSETKILKKENEIGVFNYETYLKSHEFAVPKYYGKWIENEDTWILIENIQGDDLREMDDEKTIMAANSLSQIQNVYWQKDEDEFKEKKTDNRFEIYWKRIVKRGLSIDDEVLRKAYQIFINRQLTCPRTLSNGDFLQYNAIHNANKVYLIDWGFGGIMPYSLDIARFIAHATIDKSTFPFYMTTHQKQKFVNKVYDNLNHKLSYEQYIFDIKLAVLNEYIEFIEANEDFNGWYYKHAKIMAKDILDSNQKGNE